MSAMAREAAEAPEAVARFLARNDGALKMLGARLRQHPPPVILTSARGSSDHAAGYFKYLIEIMTGVPCCSMGASVVSVYGAKLAVKDAVCITISQSGMSPDIVALQAAARAAGAYTVALVNAEDSLVANRADLVLPLCAGPEKSVAATKSFIAACAASAAIAAHWRRPSTGRRPSPSRVMPSRSMCSAGA
jgi:glutamine---fructose-6-phosphate transaminase (isomerizing)